VLLAQGEGPQMPHSGCRGSKKGLCQVKLVPSGAQTVIRLDELNDPRPGGHASPKEGRGVVTRSGIRTMFCLQIIGKGDIRT